MVGAQKESILDIANEAAEEASYIGGSPLLGWASMLAEDVGAFACYVNRYEFITDGSGGEIENARNSLCRLAATAIAAINTIDRNILNQEENENADIQGAEGQEQPVHTDQAGHAAGQEVVVEGEGDTGVPAVTAR